MPTVTRRLPVPDLLPHAAHLPGLALAGAGLVVAAGVHAVLPGLPWLTAAVLLGIVVANVPGPRRLLGPVARPGLGWAARKLLRLGVVLLGLDLSLSAVAALGWEALVLIVVIVAATFFGTLLLGRLAGLPGHQPLLVATGFSICGASAIGAMSGVTRSDERETATPVALVTLCGTLAIFVLPALRVPLGLDALDFGRWVGASVHDVGQVVATAQTAGPRALAAAAVVKLTRVLLLAPLVAGVGLWFRRHPGSVEPGARRPPLVPLFVAAFVALIVVRSLGWAGPGVVAAADAVRGVALAAALFALGTAVDVRVLVRTGARATAVALASWAIIAVLSLGAVHLLA